MSKTDLPKIGPRKNKKDKKAPIPVTYRFKSIDHEFTIKASPEAWEALHNKCFGAPDTYEYTASRKGLFADLWPFISAAAVEARKPKPKAFLQMFRNALYIQAAIINDLSRQQNRKKKKGIEAWDETLSIFKSIWTEYAQKPYVKLQLLQSVDDGNDKHGTELAHRFYAHYVIKGREIMEDKRDRADFLLNFLIATLKGMELKNLPGYRGNKRNFQEVLSMTIAVKAVLIHANQDNITDQRAKKYMNLARKAFPFLS